MARFVIATFQQFPQFEERIVMGTRRFILQFTFFGRLQSWHMNIYRDDGVRTPIALGRRLSPGWGPLFGIPIDDGPEGLIYFRGTDPYIREDLGGTLLAIFLPLEDIPSSEADPEAPQVEIV